MNTEDLIQYLIIEAYATAIYKGRKPAIVFDISTDKSVASYEMPANIGASNYRLHALTSSRNKLIARMC